jgi:hypothetical protein
MMEILIKIENINHFRLSNASKNYLNLWYLYLCWKNSYLFLFSQILSIKDEKNQSWCRY